MSRSKRKYTLGQPHLLRRRGKGRLWTGWIDGREVSLGTPDRVEAQRKLDEFVARRQREQAAADRGGVEKGAPPVEAPLLTELAMQFAEYCRPPRHTKKTADSYAQRVLYFIEWAETNDVRRADEITFKLMSKYVRSRTQAGAQAATVNRDLTPVRQMFAFAKREGLIPKDPFKHEDFTSLKLREPRPKPNALALSPQQVDLFLDTADRMTHPAYGALFRLTAGSAIRIDEARHLDARDVDEARGLLTITPKPNWTTKGYRYREIPVSARTAAAVRAFVARQNEVALDDKSVWKEIQRIRKEANLPKFSIHDLRRAWASAVHANGASLKQVSVWLGHADVQTTERYIRVFLTQTSGHQYLPR
ncbi:tyrosine-type recombinase/integrase [Polyangium spumosum]|uniref:Tyrosine-type recombinase/integrase n=1 Tax=Polyangium spumosum TaxID=889282 RepID=A0A6N7Q1P2_9BACT|nr:tyrosine-type recombinase/integrase [Polyangium spumosum]MRG96525.1 tyrosine-type recombinase/integrase [Polyangium spumosum]